MLKRCFGLHFIDEFRKPLLPKKLEPLALYSASGTPFITVVFCTCLLSTFSLAFLLSLGPVPVASVCYSVYPIMCYSSLCQTPYLAAPGPGSHFRASSNGRHLASVLADTVSEISRKFLFHGNTPLTLLGVCVCVMSMKNGRCKSS